MSPAFRCWFDSAFLEDGLNRVAGDVMPQVEDCASDSGVSPGRVLSCHANHQLGDVRFPAWSSRAAFSRAIVLGSDQVPVPTQQRVSRDDCAKRSECRSPDCLRLFCEPSTLSVRPAHPLLAKLLTQ